MEITNKLYYLTMDGEGGRGRGGGWLLLVMVNFSKKKKPALFSSNINNKSESILINAINYRVLLEWASLIFFLYFYYYFLYEI